MLRVDGRTDPAKLDSLLQLLRTAALGEEAQRPRGEESTNVQGSVSDDAEGDASDIQPHHRVRVNRRRNHSQGQLGVLRRWFDAHAHDPYPTPVEKTTLAKQCGMEVRQIEHWFTNRRKRHWKPPNQGDIVIAQVDDDDDDGMAD